MSATFTIILPHKRQDRNDDALRVCLDMLFANTVNDFVLSIDACEDEPLVPRVNRMVAHAPTDICVYWASDTFAAPAWDVPMLQAYAPTRFITGILVEPGVISMHGQNYHRDFGRRPETFDRAGFEAWVMSGNAPMLAGKGWYAPYMFNRDRWLEFGGYNEQSPGVNGFTSADVELFDKWEMAGNAVIRSYSFAYHLQRWSDPEEQEAAKRA